MELYEISLTASPNFAAPFLTVVVQHYGCETNVTFDAYFSVIPALHRTILIEIGATANARDNATRCRLERDREGANGIFLQFETFMLCL